MHQVPPRNPQYSAADLWPPGSKGNVEFPPAAFHPVYLGNFMCQQPGELVPRVQQYFASKGLLARMVFVRDGANDPFRAFQNRNKMYDCLVYFTRQQDAEDAVTYLHREKYFGHRLNIFPGRTPVMMDQRQTVGYNIPGYLSHWPDYMFEEHIKNKTHTDITCSKRLDEKRIIIEYAKPGTMTESLRRYQYMVPFPVALQSRQHFLEKDAVRESRGRMIHTVFMAMCPGQQILDVLFSGSILGGLPDWTTKGPVLSIKDFKLPENHVRFQIAKTTLENFGVVCAFGVEKPKSKNGKKRARKFKQDVKKHRQFRKEYYESLEESYKALKVDLPWQRAVQD